MEMRRFEFRLTSVSLFHLLFPLYLDVMRLVGWQSLCAELVLKKKRAQMPEQSESGTAD